VLPLLLPDEPPDELELPELPEPPPGGLPELPLPEGLPEPLEELPDEPLEPPEELDEPPKPVPPDELEERPPDELEELPDEPVLPELDPVVPPASHGWVLSVPPQPGAAHKTIHTDPQIGNTYLRMLSSQVGARACATAVPGARSPASGGGVAMRMNRREPACK
jgi:hypothetical protein